MNRKRLISAAASLATGVLFTTTSYAQQYHFVATDKQIETQFCVNAGNNDAQAMKRSLRVMGIHQRKMHINNIRCNDLSPAKFTHKYGAANTFRYLNQLSLGRNKVKASVTIRDVAKTNTPPITIHVTSAN